MLHRVLFSILLSGIVVITAVAQPPQSYIDQFNEAKLHLANHKFEAALPLLEELWKTDRYNGNLNYLLGLCLTKMDQDPKRVVTLLEEAEKSFSRDYDPGSYKERHSPEYVYYYLIIAYSRTGQCPKALGTLNKFYTVYSYEDEYYLIDGQKWVRECWPEEPEKEEAEPMLAEESKPERPKHQPAEEMPLMPAAIFPVQNEPENPGNLAQREVEPIEVTPAEPNFDEEPVALVDPTEGVVAEIPVIQAPEAPPVAPDIRQGPVIRERLTPVNNSGEVKTKPIAYTTYSSLYGVQVGALLEPKFTAEFKNLKNVEVYVDQNGVYRYVVGRFNYRRQAETLLELIRTSGYPDAFIVDVNGANERFTEEVVTLGNQPIKRAPNGKVEFRVQVGAYANYMEDRVAQAFLDIDNLTAMTQGEVTILTVGSYGTYEEASAEKARIKSLGYGDAFVVAFNGNYKITVREAIMVQNQRKEEERMANTAKKKKRKNQSNDTENAMQFRR